MIAHDASYVFLVTVTPVSVFTLRKDPGGDTRVVNGADGLVSELVIVDQAAVPDRAVQDFECRSVGNPGSLLCHV